MILERITFTRPKPPTDYSLDVRERWLAIRTLYLMLRNREPRK